MGKRCDHVEDVVKASWRTMEDDIMTRFDVLGPEIENSCRAVCMAQIDKMHGSLKYLQESMADMVQEQCGSLRKDLTETMEKTCDHQPGQFASMFDRLNSEQEAEDVHEQPEVEPQHAWPHDSWSTWRPQWDGKGPSPQAEQRDDKGSELSWWTRGSNWDQASSQTHSWQNSWWGWNQ